MKFQEMDPIKKYTEDTIIMKEEKSHGMKQK